MKKTYMTLLAGTVTASALFAGAGFAQDLGLVTGAGAETDEAAAIGQRTGSPEDQVVMVAQDVRGLTAHEVGRATCWKRHDQLDGLVGPLLRLRG